MGLVTFATGCYHKDAPRICEPSFFKRLVDQHSTKFDQVILVSQDWLPGMDQQTFTNVPIAGVDNIKTSDHKNILERFNVPFPNANAEVFYDNGPSDPHWWVKHLCNILVAVHSTTSEWLVWQDSDITIERNQALGWIQTAIDCMQRHGHIFMVSPGEGTQGNELGFGTTTKVASQQIFIANRQKLLSMNWNTPFPYDRHNIPRTIYPDPFAQYWYMAEGLICRYMAQNGLKRMVLDSNRWRYWHHNPVHTMFTKVI